jgi:hypothetical protein
MGEFETELASAWSNFYDIDNKLEHYRSEYNKSLKEVYKILALDNIARLKEKFPNLEEDFPKIMKETFRNFNTFGMILHILLDDSTCIESNFVIYEENRYTININYKKIQILSIFQDDEDVNSINIKNSANFDAVKMKKNNFIIKDIITMITFICEIYGYDREDTFLEEFTKQFEADIKKGLSKSISRLKLEYL